MEILHHPQLPLQNPRRTDLLGSDCLQDMVVPNQDAVVWISRSALCLLNSELQPELEANRIADISADAKVVEENGWRNELEMAKQIVPEIRPLLLMRIFKGDYS